MISYFVLIFRAIFRPGKLRRQIRCSHEELHGWFIDAGMDKVLRCKQCKGFFFAHAGSVY